MNALTVGAIACAIGVPASLKLLHLQFPAKAIMPGHSSFAELKSQYKKWTSWLSVLMLAIAAPLTFVFWYLLKNLADWYASRLPLADVTFAPMVPAYWALPAALFAVVCSGMAAMWIVRRLLGQRYGEFLAYWSLSSGMDPISANVVVFQASTIICIGLIFLGLRTHVQLAGDALVVNGFLSTGEVRYSLADIEDIKTSARFVAPNGNVVARREYVVTFTGGRQWTTSYIASDPDQETKRRFMALLAARSGKPIEEVALFAKGEI
jgi:hypothetical protein